MVDPFPPTYSCHWHYKKLRDYWQAAVGMVTLVASFNVLLIYQPQTRKCTLQFRKAKQFSFSSDTVSFVFHYFILQLYIVGKHKATFVAITNVPGGTSIKGLKHHKCCKYQIQHYISSKNYRYVIMCVVSTFSTDMIPV